MSPTTVLVTGVRGKTGREVAAQLRDREDLLVRGGTRNPEPNGMTGVRPALFDWQDPHSWRDALDGVDAIYLMRPDIETAPAQVAQFVAAVPDHTRIVLLSEMGGERPESGSWVRGVEGAVAEGSATWTILRPSWFSQVFTDDRFYLGAIRERGELALPSMGAPISIVDARDIAAVAVEALLSSEHAGQAYTLTGPSSVSLEGVAELLAAAAGHAVRYVDMPVADAVRGLAEEGMEPWMLDVASNLYDRVCSGGFGLVTDDVRRVTGREPQGLDAFVEEHAEAWKRTR
jgi:uncharacterized protein YbjT (DUF2867 family)